MPLKPIEGLTAEQWEVVLAWMRANPRLADATPQAILDEMRAVTLSEAGQERRVMPKTITAQLDCAAIEDAKRHSYFNRRGG